MKVLTGLTVVSVIAAFGIFATPASAKSIWDQLNDTAPRSIFDQLNDSAPERAPDKDLAGE